jgi:hypothetical protein
MIQINIESPQVIDFMRSAINTWRWITIRPSIDLESRNLARRVVLGRKLSQHPNSCRSREVI